MIIKFKKNNTSIYTRLSKLPNRSRKVGLFVKWILLLSVYITAQSLTATDCYSQENESITILISSENTYNNPIGDEGYYFENLEITPPSKKTNFAYYTDTDPINFKSSSATKTLTNETAPHSQKNRRNSTGTSSYANSDRTYGISNYYQYNGLHNRHRIETVKTDSYIFANTTNVLKYKSFELYMPAEFCYTHDKGELSFGGGLKSVLRIDKSLELNSYNNIKYSYFDNIFLPAAGVELHCGDSFRMGTDFNMVKDRYLIKNKFEYAGDFITFYNNNKLTCTSKLIDYDPELSLGFMYKDIFYIRAYKEEITGKSQYIPETAEITERNCAGGAASFYLENFRIGINAAALGVKPLFTISTTGVSFNSPDSYVFSAMMDIETKKLTFNIENFTILKSSLINTAGFSAGLKDIKIEKIHIHIRPQFYLADYFTDFVVNVNNGFELRFYGISLVYADINAGICLEDFTGDIQAVPDFNISGGVKLFF